MNIVNVDFNEQIGSVKPVNAVCCAPYNKIEGKNQRTIKKYFTEAKIPFCRLHDCCGPYGGAYFVDVPNIFRNFDADENNPANYDFHYTDEYIRGIQEAGCESYYRLGVTIEWGSKKYTSVMPADFDKWARICEHIIMHYNEGWADGYEYNLRYWEIWNEPENPGDSGGQCQWSGTREDFYRLYKISAKYLKNRFPDIKIGGYGSCGFYAVTDENVPEAHKAFVPYFEDFLKMVKEENAPLDFFSWHIYTSDIDKLMTHAVYVRETLDKNGFKNTESHLNEWNYAVEGSGFKEKHTAEGASFLASAMCWMQNTPYIDMAMYYCFSSLGRYNGFLNQNDMSVDVPWYVYVAFGYLYELKNAVSVKTEGAVYATAAKDEEKQAVLVSNFDGEDDMVNLSLDGVKNGTARVKLISAKENFEEIFAVSVKEKTEISFKLPKQTVALLEIE